MGKELAERRVAVLMVSKLALAQELGSIHAADSVPFWLQEDQYVESEDHKGFAFIAERAPLLMKIAAQKQMVPLGLFVIQGGEVVCYMDKESICADCLDFTTTLFKTHIQCWLSLIHLWDREGKLSPA